MYKPSMLMVDRLVFLQRPSVHKRQREITRHYIYNDIRFFTETTHENN